MKRNSASPHPVAAAEEEIVGESILNGNVAPPKVHIHVHTARREFGESSATIASDGKPRKCRGPFRRCLEQLRSEGLFLRNEDLPLQMEMYLVCSAVTILIIRLSLFATGYPQLGGDGIHIAHMLWGGLLMFLSQMLSFAYLGQHIQRLSAVLGGIGFGTFIDELGKFITSDNDYFFKLTPFLLYTAFCTMFVVLKCVEPLFSPQRFTDAENLANTLNMMSVYATAGLSAESRLILVELIEGCDPEHPIVPALRDYVHLPMASSGMTTSREHYYLQFRKAISEMYSKLVRSKYVIYTMCAFFILQCVTQIVDLLYLLLDGSYYKHFNGEENVDDDGFFDHLMGSPGMKFLREVTSGKLSDTLLLEETDRVTKLHIFQLVAVTISACCVICGVYFLSVVCSCRSNNPERGCLSQNGVGFTPLSQQFENRRKLAFVWFRRSMLVRLFIIDSLSLYHSQFMAFGDVIFTLMIVAALSFMIAQEESTDRMRRLSASGSIDLDLA